MKLSIEYGRDPSRTMNREGYNLGSGSSQKSLMRSLGEFVGHIKRGVRTDPARSNEVRREEQVEDLGNMVLRRTVIDEVEIRPENAAESES